MKQLLIIMLCSLLFLSGCNNSGSTIALVDNSTTMPVSITNPVNDAGNLKVSVMDHASEIIDLKVNRKLDNLTLITNTSINDKIITVNIPIVTPTIAHVVCLKDKQGSAFYQGKIINVVSLGAGNYNLTLDTPLDFAFEIDDGCSLSSTDLTVDGSIEPVIFSISPTGLSNDTIWHVTRMICIFGGVGVGPSNEAPDDSDFLITNPVTNGIIFRMVDGITKNIFTAQTNGDIRSRAYDLTYVPKSKAGLYTVAFRRSFNGADKNGVVIELVAGTNDAFQVIIQDDLTDMYGGQCIVQGHVVEHE